LECGAQVLKAPGNLPADINFADRQAPRRCFDGRLADLLWTVAGKKPGNESG
jgi:hypothetical protein